MKSCDTEKKRSRKESKRLAYMREYARDLAPAAA